MFSDKIKALRERDSNKTKYEKEIEKLKDAKRDLEKLKTEAKQEIDKLKSDISKLIHNLLIFFLFLLNIIGKYCNLFNIIPEANTVLQNQLQELKKQVESLNNDLTKEKASSADLKTKLDVLNKGNVETSKLQKEVNNYTNISYFIVCL